MDRASKLVAYLPFIMRSTTRGWSDRREDAYRNPEEKGERKKSDKVRKSRCKKFGRNKKRRRK